MAKAIKVPTDDFDVQITLNKKEAQTLLSILRTVGGHPERTARKYSDAIYNELRNLVDPIYPVLQGWDTKSTGGGASIWFIEDKNI
jgi:hypothetical protein